ncbi:DUF3846 domain-containing protein [Ktedonospora formicarum]|uniref:Uncharacterized protein n=1 Tax=Ktedonospora formicarum TaxID=2778364 RepID=A0A8J3I371_9CHLR|nr:DUF3846 domain-containing protein [Ktedonospora formicarum]GHO48479.1 hypothetical protein KSX_66420 [Ktedonospora formicarum]
MAFLIPADSTQLIRWVAPENGQHFHLPQLRTLLSCDIIEICQLPTPSLILVIDDEGKFAPRPRNERATRLVGFAPPSQIVTQMLALREAGVHLIWTGETLTDLTTEVDWIAGDALLCCSEEIR